MSAADARCMRSCLPGAETAQADRDTSVFNDLSLRTAICSSLLSTYEQRVSLLIDDICSKLVSEPLLNIKKYVSKYVSGSSWLA